MKEKFTNLYLPHMGAFHNIDTTHCLRPAIQRMILTCLLCPKNNYYLKFAQSHLLYLIFPSILSIFSSFPFNPLYFFFSVFFSITLLSGLSLMFSSFNLHLSNFFYMCQDWNKVMKIVVKNQTNSPE
jgi:hypothetical protein